jgi:hypothetical protein
MRQIVGNLPFHDFGRDDKRGTFTDSRYTPSESGKDIGGIGRHHPKRLDLTVRTGSNRSTACQSGFA